MKLEASLLVVAGATLLASCLPPIALDVRAPVTIATANPAAIYYPVGNAVCRMVNLANADDRDKRCQAIVSEGAEANVTKVSRGDVTLGLTQSDLAYGAYRGEGSFASAGPHPELRTVIALQREAFTVIARANSEIRDFPGSARQARRHRQGRRRLHLHTRRRPRTLRLDDLRFRPRAGAWPGRTEPDPVQQRGRRHHLRGGASRRLDARGNQRMPRAAGARCRPAHRSAARVASLLCRFGHPGRDV